MPDGDCEWRRWTLYTGRHVPDERRGVDEYRVRTGGVLEPSVLLGSDDDDDDDDDKKRSFA